MAVSSASPLLAVNGVWTGAVSSPPATPTVQNWSDPLNWSGGVIADGVDALADFSTLDLIEAAAGDTYNVTLDTARTVGGLTFGDTDVNTLGAYQITGGTNVLTLQTTTGVPTITTNAMGAGRYARIDAIIGGTQGLTITGAGTTWLTNTANTYAGNTTFLDTNVRLGASNTFNGQVGANGSTLTLQGTNTITNGNTASGTMYLGNNVVVPTGSTATFNLGNRSSFGQSGTGNQRTWTGGGDIIFNMATNTSRNDFLNTFSGFTGNITFKGVQVPNTSNPPDGGVVSPVGRLMINGGNLGAGFTSAHVHIEEFAQLVARTNSGGNTVSIGALSGTSPTAGFNGTEAGGRIEYSVGGLNLSTSFAGLFAGNVAVTKVGTGTLTLSRSQFHTNTTNINAGTLALTGTANLGNAGTTFFSSVVTIAGGATLDVSGLSTPFTTVVGVDASSNPVNQILQTSAGATAANIVGAADFTGGNLNVGTLTGAGTLAVNGNLGLSGVTLSMELSPNVAPGGTNDLITVTGTTALNGGALNLGLLGGLSTGTYTLIQSAGGFTGSPSNLTFNFGARGTPPALQVVGNALQVNVTTTLGASIVWKGNVDGNWNVNQTANWLNGATPDKFFQLDAVTFDDTATTFGVVLNGSLSPNSVMMNNTTDYTFSGSGGINGSGLFTKKGAGKLTLDNSGVSGFSGGLRIEAGTVDALTRGATALGTGTITLAGGTLRAITPTGGNVTIGNAIDVTGSATFITANSGTTARQTILSGAITGAGTLTITNDNAASVKGLDVGNTTGFTGTMNVGTAFALRFTNTANGNPAMTLNIDAGGSVGTINGAAVVTDLGKLTGTGTLRGHQSSGNGSTAEFRIGGANLSSTFDGTIVDGAQGTTVRPVLITKTGTGTLTFTGVNTYTGVTTVQGGQLVLGELAQQPVLGGATVTAPGGADIQAGKLVLKYSAATETALTDQVLATLDAGFDQTPAKFATGLLRSSTLPANRFLGWTKNATLSQIEVAVTLQGDADLSFNVNFNDLLALAKNYNGTLKNWYEGDFDYNGAVNFNDLLALAKNYNQSLSVDEQALLGSGFSSDFALALSLVPEPTSLMALGLGATMLRRRRA